MLIRACLPRRRLGPFVGVKMFGRVVIVTGSSPPASMAISNKGCNWVATHFWWSPFRQPSTQPDAAGCASVPALDPVHLLEVEVRFATRICPPVPKLKNLWFFKISEVVQGKLSSSRSKENQENFLGFLFVCDDLSVADKLQL